ncbi:MAG TPA: VOC family protein [Candidatus Bathyarchaeia archaeon]|nr:VOC family protein [Candidatus Bathyarchaeia archaeon]
MAKIVHFEIESNNPQESLAFYQEVFGWQVSQMGDMEYWLIKSGDEQEPGINGAIMRSEASKLQMVNTISVPSIEAYLDKIKQAGGMAVTPIEEVPGVGLFAYCHDPQGVKFGVMQFFHSEE